MIKTGFIKAVGEPRTWNTKEGEQRYTAPVTISIPYVRQDGKQGEDEMICDHTYGNADYMEQIKDLAQRHVEVDMTIAFAVHDWKGKSINNVRLTNISQRIGGEGLKN